MNHMGYKIEAVTEMTTRGKDVPDEEIKTFMVSLDDKVIAVGLPSIESAKNAIEHRHKVRSRGGLDPVG
jgi:hypothetical protein